MTATNMTEWFAKGVEALHHDHVYLARACFEQAVTEQRSPLSSSYLALCQAKTRGTFSDAIARAREAVAADPANPALYHNLGCIYLLAGKRTEAIETFRQGLRVGGGEDIASELERLGTRRAPPIKRLPRNHPVNKYLGIVLSRLGLR
ncbi:MULTISPECIES: tetratricopeptide repeat protein [Geobacter]|uniref:tetratricopeptide repeat protein n=1 Tax=Geobacter TaxID=28231 RepID=UPI0025742ADD|nr:tetratricopeptide repeat protein [Geobacter sulfurreducens]BEH09102.1 hypothetical protein GSUET_07140 [Geobacter sulfurreducens subsp. ethanolicus]BET56993.1 hypothetical protein GEO60473_00330 [Geobacter sp. 60473]